MKIGIIGCGNMGEAIMSRLLAGPGKREPVMVSEQDAKRRSHLGAGYDVSIGPDNCAVARFADVLILAVKPKDIEGVFTEEMRAALSAGKLVISIAAGITTKCLEKLSGPGVPVIRAMPNMGAIVGEAITSVSAGKAAGRKHMAAAKKIFSRVGEVLEVRESLVDAVTAISGSGPAYFFYLVAALSGAGRDIGLDGATSGRLALKTAIGSSRLLEALNTSPDALVEKVASKGGTTEAALKVFEKRRFKYMIRDAARAARRRSKELSR